MARRKRTDLPRVKRFIFEYVWGKNWGHVAKSAEAAGYGKGSLDNAGNYGAQLLRRPAVKAEVDKHFAEKEEQLKQKAVRAAAETYQQAVVDIGDLFDGDKLLPLKDVPESARRAIASIEVEKRYEGHGDDAEVFYVTKIKLHDKRASQELFLKYAGKLKEKVELEAGASLEQLIDAALKRES